MFREGDEDEGEGQGVRAVLIIRTLESAFVCVGPNGVWIRVPSWGRKWVKVPK